MIKDLPLFEMVLDEDTEGLYTISLVSRPAVKAHWLAFKEDEKRINFSVTDEEQHKVLAVIARADFPIYRIDEQTGNEFYVTFSKETIQKMSQRFLKNGYQNLINVEHQENSYIDGVELEQIFIKDVEKGICPQGFSDIEDGSLFGVYKIEDDNVWDAIKEGIFTGVSLEGLFRLQPMEKEPEERVIDSLEDLYNLIRGN